MFQLPRLQGLSSTPRFAKTYMLLFGQLQQYRPARIAAHFGTAPPCIWGVQTKLQKMLGLTILGLSLFVEAAQSAGQDTCTSLT